MDFETFKKMQFSILGLDINNQDHHHEYIDDFLLISYNKIILASENGTLFNDFQTTLMNIQNELENEYEHLVEMREFIKEKTSSVNVLNMAKIADNLNEEYNIEDHQDYINEANTLINSAVDVYRTDHPNNFTNDTQIILDQIINNFPNVINEEQNADELAD